MSFKTSLTALIFASIFSAFLHRDAVRQGFLWLSYIDLCSSLPSLLLSDSFHSIFLQTFPPTPSHKSAYTDKHTDIVKFGLGLLQIHFILFQGLFNAQDAKKRNKKPFTCFVLHQIGPSSSFLSSYVRCTPFSCAITFLWGLPPTNINS